MESVTFNAEDFPAASGAVGAGAGGGALGRWAAFAGAQGNANVHDEEHFPALPSLSKNQRRRIKEQQRSLADRLSAAAQPARVLHRATPGGTGPSAAGGSDAAPQLVPGMSDFPALQSGGPAPSAPPAARQVSAAHTASSSSSGTGASTSAAASSSMAAFTPVSRTADVVAPVSVNRKPPSLGQEEFPSLGGKGKGKGKGVGQTPASPPPAVSPYAGVASGSQPAYTAAGLSKTDVLHSLFMRPGSAAATMGGGAGPSASSSSAAAAADEPEPAPLALDDFPSLPPGSKGKGRAKVVLRASPAKPQPASPAAAAPAPPAGGGGGGAGGVSDSLKAANKALVERIKQRLTGDAFSTFRQQSLLFMRGEVSAEEYHDYMVGGWGRGAGAEEVAPAWSMFRSRRLR